MNFRTLLLKSKAIYAKKPEQVENIFSIYLFQDGAIWMAEKMNDIDPINKNSIDKAVSYHLYGYLKYGICLIGFITSFIYFNESIVYLPISILIFYFFEVHFLFLFPLLIDKVQNPIWKSIETTYKIGIFRTMFLVIQIAIFMLLGIFDFKNPLKNWHIGCLCIIIWYQDEVRNRL